MMNVPQIRQRVRLGLALSAVMMARTLGAGQTAPAGVQTPSITANQVPPIPTAAQVPTGRQGRGGYPLPPLPAVFETYQHKVRVSVVARGEHLAAIRANGLTVELPDGPIIAVTRRAAPPEPPGPVKGPSGFAGFPRAP